jgi:hypothetical protein
MRNVHDGLLLALISHEPRGWHLSISHRQQRRGVIHYTRYPTWDEIADADERLLAPGLWMAMVLPPSDNYVAEHKTTFHLFEIEPRDT